MPKTPFDQLSSHDFYSNSLESLVTDDDLEDFLESNPSHATSLIQALDALEQAYQRVKVEKEAHDEETDDEEEDDEEIDD